MNFFFMIDTYKYHGHLGYSNFVFTYSKFYDYNFHIYISTQKEKQLGHMDKYLKDEDCSWCTVIVSLFKSVKIST